MSETDVTNAILVAGFITLTVYLHGIYDAIIKLRRHLESAK